MRSFTITENDAGQRLDKFLSKAVKKLPPSLLYKYIRTKRIKVGGKRCAISTRLCEGDRVDLYINDEFFEDKSGAYPFLSAPADLDILYEDENILLLDKKPGLLVHEDDREKNDTLVARMLHYLYQKGEYNPASENSFVPSLCNRIDRNTGGIVIAAKNAATLRVLNQKIKDRELQKRYLCIVNGVPPKKEDTLTAYLEKDTNKKQVFIKDRRTPGAKTIRTRYTVLKTNGRYSLLEIDLLTGRTHQIRAHMAHIGCPLAGDGKYGSNALNRGSGFRYQALYSYQLTFRFQTDAAHLGYLDGRTFTVPKVWFADMV